ncbi:MAG: hypothetical protein COY66_00060 [Candidatus Kerfeldbacteria bacterium CG_4_10_14_0_8_um_filter_42_10]|uniref:Glucose-1-phosphate thymidylyltransferase n=1 Tax=Candidatus Kerfeldbacteria bacterium CG_4_10_14_0_8_um_filter_42_10 TaxID=2014248 RepID=A0A2M7RL72_9BACT|nr:MAG: hypothetical protein COY66_00060 [Candidatus Kerfeldbacteria bacterium CG_4_10_14_0_8_um_filter_42_10]
MTELAITDPSNFFKIGALDFRDFIEKQEKVWMIIVNLADYLEKTVTRRELSQGGQSHPSVVIAGEKVKIDGDVIIDPFVMLDAKLGPIWIGKGTKILAGTRIRGPALIGKNCQICGEVKNSIILDGAHSDHLSNYIGDSVVGQNCRLGCGTILSNRRFDRGEIKIRLGNKLIPTEMDRLGAILGDQVKTGCGAILGPGALVGKNSWIGQKVMVKNEYVAKNILLTLKQNIKVKKIRS